MSRTIVIESHPYWNDSVANMITGNTDAEPLATFRVRAKDHARRLSNLINRYNHE